MSRSKITIKLGGQSRTLKFTLATFKRYDTEKGNDGEAIKLIMASPLNALLTLGTYALTWPGNSNDISGDPEDPETLEMVSDWLDDLSNKDLEKVAQLLMNSIKKYGAAWGERDQMTPEEREEMMKTILQVQE